MDNAYDKNLEGIIRKNLGRRGLGGVGAEGELIGAAASLMKGATILIVTGFIIRDAMAGETDGPVGAVSLAGALKQLGKKVVLLTDRYSEKILYSCLKAKELECPVEVIGMGNEGMVCRGLLRKYMPSHVVAIERPGRTLEGGCYTMKGEDISNLVPNTDILFEEAKRQGIVTVAVGDGGNEVGMGKIRAYIIESVYKGKQICAAVSTDFLIVSGVSNWGGHALAAALSILSNNMLLHDRNTEKKILEDIANAGAVDGYTKKRAATVDGLSLEYNLDILDLLRNTVLSELERL